MADQTLNVPSLLFVILVTSFAIRYFFFSSRSPTAASRGRLIDPALVDQIATMFPQADRRSIQWDLQRNGGSVAATTERILTRGSLDIPPPSFQPTLPPFSSPSSAASAAPPKPLQPDLITRYNLKSKLATTEPSVNATEQGAARSTGSWSDSKSERAELLRRRREEMILNARRRLEQKEQQSSR